MEPNIASVVGLEDASGANERARGLEAVEDLLIPNGEEEDESLEDNVGDSALRKWRRDIVVGVVDASGADKREGSGGCGGPLDFK